MIQCLTRLAENGDDSSTDEIMENCNCDNHFSMKLFYNYLTPAANVEEVEDEDPQRKNNHGKSNMQFDEFSI